MNVMSAKEIAAAITDQMEHLLNCYVDEKLCPVCQKIRVAVEETKANRQEVRS